MLCDEQIRKLNMIKPFAEKTKNGVVSFGVGSYGYDARLSSEFAITKPKDLVEIDPKGCSIENIVEEEYYLLQPGNFILGLTVEEFSMPSNVTAICVGKSTYARCGIIVTVTPIEAGWSGRITLEIYNSNSYPVKLYVNEGICQFLFFKSDQCQETYDGNYNDAKGIMGAQVKKRKKVIILEGDENTGKTTYAQTFYPNSHINFFKDNPTLRKKLKNKRSNLNYLSMVNEELLKDMKSPLIEYLRESYPETMIKNPYVDYLPDVIRQVQYICKEIKKMFKDNDVVCVERLFAGYKYYEGFLENYDLEPLKCEEELRKIADIEYIFFGDNDDYKRFTK